MRKRVTRLVAAAALQGAVTASPKPAAATPETMLVCQAYCLAAAAACVARTQNIELCGGFFDGCFYGCTL